MSKSKWIGKFLTYWDKTAWWEKLIDGVGTVAGATIGFFAPTLGGAAAGALLGFELTKRIRASATKIYYNKVNKMPLWLHKKTQQDDLLKEYRDVFANMNPNKFANFLENIYGIKTSVEQAQLIQQVVVQSIDVNLIKLFNKYMGNEIVNGAHYSQATKFTKDFISGKSWDDMWHDNDVSRNRYKDYIQVFLPTSKIKEIIAKVGKSDERENATELARSFADSTDKLDKLTQHMAVDNVDNRANELNFSSLKTKDIAAIAINSNLVSHTVSPDQGSKRPKV